jgi:multidrug efflux pump
MLLSDVSVKRPVFATVVSLLLITFGVMAYLNLPVRELPDVDQPVVSIDTTYRGASAEVVDTRITQLLEGRISGIEGIREIESNSQDGRSDISIRFSESRNIDDAANDVRSAVSRVLDNLPDEADPPEVQKAETDARPIMWASLASENMNMLELADFADRYIVDRLSQVDGVARVQVGGAQRYAMRVWLDRVALAARKLTVVDVESALRAENIELPAGQIESTERQFTVRTERNYSTPDDFRRLVLRKGEDGYLVRLGDVARIEVGPEQPRVFFRSNGKSVVGLGVVRQSTANTLEVANKVWAEVERIIPTLPPGTSIYPGYNQAIFIDAAIGEVQRTLLIAIGLVVLVIYIFLGSARAALVPAVTVPICLTATFAILWAAGLSINLMTLLALVLSIGLVVDDSIVVLENIQRRVDEGEPPLVAAYRGARQVGFAVIATTLVLVAVFVPILFLEGTTGRYFAELGLTVSGAVILSSFIALTLSAMMCSKLLKKGDARGPIARTVDKGFRGLSKVYQASLESLLPRPRLIGLVVLAALGAIFALLSIIPEALTPEEDRGAFFVMVRGPEGQSFEATVATMHKIQDILLPYVDKGEAQRVLMRAPGFGSTAEYNVGFGIVNLTLWNERERSAEEIVNELRGKLSQIPDARIGIFVPQPLGRGRDSGVQFVIGGSSYEELSEWRDVIVKAAEANPGLADVDSDLKETKPKLKVQIDQTRAADLGVSVETIGRTLETMLGGRRVTTYLDRGEEYDVILQSEDEKRRQPSDLTNIFVRSGRTGELIPLSNLVTIEEIAAPARLNRFNRLRAVTITASLAPGYSMGEALNFLEQTVRDQLPATAVVDYKGESAEFMESGGALIFTFAMALVIVFLVLAAQFESFIHPLVIMTTVPLAAAGGLYGLFMVDSTLNIYSKIGMVILVGLAAKNGILIVEFANQMRDAGMAVRDAVLKAAQIRFRAIIMTGLSTAFGALPLVLAVGAGSGARSTIGIVIFSGVLLATLLTLFVVPVFYNLLAKYTKPPGHLARELETWERREAENGGAII